MAISNLTVSSGSMSVSKVVVIDGNNLIVRIDRGVAGRGITDVEAVEIDNSLYLVFSFTDGTTETVGPVGTIQYIGQAPIVVNGSTISLSTVPVNLGGTGATTAANARTNLNAANQDTTISAGTGLSGGGSLAANRTLSIANTAVTAAAYGSASKTLTATVNAQGQLTALADTDIAIANTQISGLGTMSTQNATSVAITGGSITGITDLAVADGGTGASDASGARTNLGAAASAITITAGTGLSGGGDLSANRTLSIANTAVTAAAYGSASNTLTATVNAQGQLTALAATPIAIANTQVSGLGTMSTQSANSVSITGGSITGITDLAIADGGTGASNAADARTNLGLGTAAVLNAGVALGVATLDAGGTVPLSQIPASIQGGVSYQGSWNAATNTPTLTSSVGSKGYYYVVSVAGSTNLNGITDWLPGDWAIFNGSVWEQIDNTDTVASVNGYVGAVVLTAADVGAPPTTRTISAGTGLTGGGDLSANRTITLADTTVTAGAYGSASSVPNYTVNAQGQLTAAASTAIAINGNQITSGVVGTAYGGTGLSSFTANGVVYASSTSALATGSALTFDGNRLIVKGGNAGQFVLDNANEQYVQQLFQRNGTANTGADLLLDGSGNTFNFRALAANMPFTWQLSASAGAPTEKLRLTATSLYTASDVNVGIGTSSTSQRLTIDSADTERTSISLSNSSVGGGFFNIAAVGSATWLGAPVGSLLIRDSNAGVSRIVLDASGNLGIGTSSPQSRLEVRQDQSGAITRVIANNNFANTGAGSSFDYYFGTTRLGGLTHAFAASGAYLGFDVWNGSAATERMRLNSSGNLGIGTSTPAVKLQVLDSSANGPGTMRLGGATFYGTIQHDPTTTGANIYDVTSGSGGGHIFRRGGSNLMLINAAGNLGLAVDPSAWASGWPAFQVGRAVMHTNTSDGRASFGNNYYVDGTNAIYIASANATQLMQVSGEYRFYTAPSGTAGNAITFTQAMTLDASGLLTVGNTSPAGSSQITAYGASNGQIAVQNSTNWSRLLQNANDLYIDNGVGGSAGNIIFRNSSSTVERARITSGGVFIVGDTSLVASSFAGVKFDGASFNGLGLNDSAAANTAGYIYFQSAGTTIGSITRVGATSAVAYNSTSDQRLKENIQDAESASALIDAIKVRQYDWKSDGSHQRYGFVAQELVAVAPEAVHQPEDLEAMMAVDYSKLVPMLVKEIQALRARVAALESA